MCDGSLDPAATTARPGGGAVCPTSTANEITCVLDATGRHSITVADAAGTKAGHYGLPPMVGGVGVAAMPCWRFVGEVDEHVRLIVTDRWGDWKPYIEVVRPEGQTLGAVTGLRDGDRGYDTGQYAIELRR